MRVSSEQGSPFYWAAIYKSSPEVFLNGQPVEHVLEADDVFGTVEVIKHNGAYPLHAGGRYITEKKTGKVEIKGELLTLSNGKGIPT